ncbi:hypothetical protein [Mesobacillus stamsii]|uniref:PIN domain-containing protein n=1 Tax=Mesobacillus stamsii TaxID=225347 RepID=A0ABU0FSW8_9BACI|nr:hypothetical protein [Mesobacillus stamsii]MDQ0413023.1 hypothetical protein [Mesobacillus stamsii]
MQQNLIPSTKKVVFLDTNILSNIITFKDIDFSQIISQVYDIIFVQRVVKEEFKKDQAVVEALINKYPNWFIFDENDEEILSEDLYDQYNIVYKDVKEKLKEMDKRRDIVGHANEGEAHSITAAYLIQGDYICSHDLSIQEAIIELDLSIENDEELRLIYQHNLYDLCGIILQNGLAKRSSCRQFVSVFHEDFRKSTNKKKN